MHAIATVVGELREQRGDTALVWANGGYVTKHSFGVYATDPARRTASATTSRRPRSTPCRRARSPTRTTPPDRSRSRRTR